MTGLMRTLFAFAATALVLSACSSGDIKPDMVSSDGLRLGASSTEIIRAPKSAENLTPAYVLGSDQTEETRLLQTKDVIANAQMELSFGQDQRAIPYVADCFMVLGLCRTELRNDTGRSVPVHVATGNQDGVWYQMVYSIRRGLFNSRRVVVSQTAYTVDASGALIDANSEVYLDGMVTRHWVRRAAPDQN